MSSGRGFLFLLGSGASRAAGIPMVGEITERVLSAEGVFRHSDGSWHLGKAPSPPLEWDTREHLRPILRLINRLKREIDGYYNPDRHPANYEDIHFLASQVHDALNGEYENPAVLALLKKLESEPELLDPEPEASLKQHWSLQELAGETTDYIHDVVASLLGPAQRLDVLLFLVDALHELAPGEATIATLNHDTLVEQILTGNEIVFTDGFGPPQRGVRYFDSALLEPAKKLRVLKVHGSVNWYRLRPDDGNWTEDEVGIFDMPDFYDSHRPDGRPQIPEQRPKLLIGTFNKAIRYTDWLFSEIFSRFQQTLKTVDTLVVCGYGFGDKGINSQITQWIPASDSHCIVIIHPRPTMVKERARGAIQRALGFLESKRRLHTVAKPADEARWADVRGCMRRLDLTDGCEDA